MKKIIQKKWAFTLIEMMIVITIIAILATTSYWNYLLYQKKEMVRQGQREIAKTIVEARNMAINGYDSLEWTISENKSIGIEISPYSWSWDLTASGNTIKICKFSPKAIEDPSFSKKCNDSDIIVTHKLQPNIVVNKIESWNQKFFWYFEAVTWESHYFLDWTKNTEDKIKFLVSYGNSDGYLSWNVEYYTKWYISDFTNN